MCVWLGTLASWRPGLIGGLVREYRCTAAVLERPPAEIVAFALRRTKAQDGRPSTAGPRMLDGSATRRRAEQLSEAQRFAAALQEGPEACLKRAERRPRGDLVVAWSEPLYPDQLRDLDDPPLCLFVRGGADARTVRERVSALVDVPLVGVVGTRSPSPYGEEMARTLGGDLARAGVVVVSGLAMGIDAIAQAAAVEVDSPLRPRTVAVLGCGADVVYPRENVRLYHDVAEKGLVVSEFAWGVPARAWRFPARNRVMAALGRGVVLVEGAVRSGARITAGFAVDLGRDVLCVPGEAGRRLSAAPNLLLRDGARVCESAVDVLQAIAASDPGPGAEIRDVGSAPPHGGHTLVLDHGGGAIRDVLHALGAAALTVDELARRCRLPAPKVAAAVSELEVEGLARRVEGGRYRLIRV
jgi:DNA processing protein